VERAKRKNRREGIEGRSQKREGSKAIIVEEQKEETAKKKKNGATKKRGPKKERGYTIERTKGRNTLNKNRSSQCKYTNPVIETQQGKRQIH
jgi:hypothetical protein